MRRVRKLRMRSASESFNRRGAILIEDALRTASLPEDHDARLILVRSFRLGAVRVNEPAAAVARRIERQWRELGRLAVHASSPGAAHANVVYFRDGLEAKTALAVRLARGEDVRAWFWRLAVRGFTPALSRDEGLRATLMSALDSEIGPLPAGLVFLRNLLRQDALDPILGALRFQDGFPLLRVFGWTVTPTRMPAFLARAGLISTPAPAIALAVTRWFAAWGLQDPRTSWLSRLLLCSDRPSLAAQPDLAVRATQWVESLLSELAPRAAPWREAPLGSHVTFPERRDTPIRFDNDVTFELDVRGGALKGTDLELRTGTNSDSVSDDEIEMARRESAPERRFDDRWASPRPVPLADVISARDKLPALEALSPTAQSATPQSSTDFTEYGGLFFVVTIMERLGIADWLAAESAALDWNLPSLILRAIAQRVAASALDPVLAAIGEAPEGPPDQTQLFVRDWVRRVRRHARLSARIGLRSLICRPGRLSFTETHIDVFFRLDVVDMRVRRAGLDIDPGWTPWLGRVVRYHYVGGEARDG
jgi:hypothetical protein